MRILGIGGLPAVKPFRRLHWPNLDEREFGTGLGSDAAAALVIDGELVVTAKEESINGVRQTGDFPAKAIEYCLSFNRLAPEEIDLLVHCYDYSDYEELYSFSKLGGEFYHTVLSKAALRKEVNLHLPTLPPKRVRQLSHHIAHAAGAYLTSGWEKCLVVVMDGLGDAQSATAYHASTRGLTAIKEIAAYDSIAVFYSLVSVHLGFNWLGDEWQLMDLAPQGDASRFRPFFEQAVQLRRDGSILVAPLRLNRGVRERENYLATRRCLFEYLGPKRLPHEEIQQRHKDVVAGLQECVNRVVLHVCKHLAEETSERRIAVTGQLALNSSANGVLLESGIFSDVYIPGAVGDDGAAIGAALYLSWQQEGVTNTRMPAVRGRASYPLDELDAAYQRFGERIRVTPFVDLEEKCQKVAGLIVAGNIVARDEGRVAFGSTIFGNRGILGNPSDPGMRERLGVLLNEETHLRPVAAAVTVEQASRWFNLPEGAQANGAVLTVPVKPPFHHELASVAQEDGTARIQTIDRRDHPELHGILVQLGKLTGREVVLTTPFNLAGHPVVNSPLEALELFLQTGLEYLVLDDNLILKSRTF